MFEVSFKMDTPFAMCSGFVALLTLALCLFGGCNNQPQAALSGPYANRAQSEFSIANDTLSIERAQDDNYLIHRKTGIRMLEESGEPGKPILEAEEWKAVYDPEEKVMTENKKGRLIRFTADGLLLENSPYRRIP